MTAAPDLPAPPTPAAAPPTVLTFEAVGLARQGQPVLRDVSLSLAAGDVCALMGVSGAGKSTLLRTAVALEPFDHGRIRVGDVVLHAGPVPRESALRALRRRIGMVFQQHALFTHLTVLDNVTLAPIHAAGRSRPQAQAQAQGLLELLGVAHRAEAFPAQISGGEAQRVAIARALALDPQVLLMDEPTAALDPARRGALADTLRALAATGRGLLITTHDIDFARAVSDRVVVLAAGVVVEEGATNTVLDAPTHAATRALLATGGSL